MIQKLLPSIKEKWPREDSKNSIFIQQDNARTHVPCDDEEFCRAATQDGFGIRLMYQPPNSPDINVLDLGFFSAIQSLHYKKCLKTTDELVSSVMRLYEDFSVVKSNRIFLTLQLSMVDTMILKGSNNYKIEHLNKEMLERQGRLPSVIRCDPLLIQQIINHCS